MRRCAVLYRTNSQSRLVEEALRRYQIQYHMVGGFSFYDRAEVKDMLSYLKLVQNPHDSIALQRVINSPAARHRQDDDGDAGADGAGYRAEHVGCDGIEAASFNPFAPVVLKEGSSSREKNAGPSTPLRSAQDDNSESACRESAPASFS
jgi:hypothetical protein